MPWLCHKLSDPAWVVLRTHNYPAANLRFIGFAYLKITNVTETELNNTAPAEESVSAPLIATDIVKRVSGPSGDMTILHGVSMQANAGEAVAIVGPSGSGKSTLLGILAGLDSPSEGVVTMQGQPLTDLDEDGRAQLRAKSVGFVFQSFQLLPGLSALENVMLPLELTQQDNVKERAMTVLDEVGLSHRASHQPLQLSGGEQQRVAVARAFVSKPTLLFADEPTGNLDSATGDRIAELMFDMRKSVNAALVLVTHDNDLAASCNRRLQMADGQLSEL